MRNILLLLQIKFKTNLQELREPIIRDEWLHYGPMTINAFYDPPLNDISKTLVQKQRMSIMSFLIAIPIGILRPPIFHQHAPK